MEYEIELVCPTIELFELAREWRNKCLETLRTPFILTKEMQEEYANKVLKNRHLNCRWWGFAENSDIYYVGLGGIENISWENRNGEISLIINPYFRRKGYGTKAVELILDQAFNYLNLENIYGEVYHINENSFSFWMKIVQIYNGYATLLPYRKYWNGKYYDSHYFNINKKFFKV